MTRLAENDVELLKMGAAYHSSSVSYSALHSVLRFGVLSFLPSSSQPANRLPISERGNDLEALCTESLDRVPLEKKVVSFVPMI